MPLQFVQLTCKYNHKKCNILCVSRNILMEKIYDSGLLKREQKKTGVSWRFAINILLYWSFVGLCNFVHLCVKMYFCAYFCSYVLACVFCACMCVYMYVFFLCVCICECVWTCVYVVFMCFCVDMYDFLCACVFLCSCVCMNVFVFLCVCIHAFSVFVWVWMYVFSCTYMCVLSVCMYFSLCVCVSVCAPNCFFSLVDFFL